MCAYKVRFCPLKIRLFWKYYAHCALIRSNAIKGLKLDSECATIPFKHASREFWPQQTLITSNPWLSSIFLSFETNAQLGSVSTVKRNLLFSWKVMKMQSWHCRMLATIQYFFFFLICDLLVAFFHYQLCSYCPPGYGFCVRTWGISFARTFFFFILH